MGQEESRRDFKTIDEAFAALPRLEQERGMRVSGYAEQIFLQACASDIYPDDIKVRVRLKPEFSETVAYAAKYFNVGKALVPELYHQLRPDFTPEEVALYRKHTTDGAKLAESLLAESLGSRPTDLNIIMEAIESHHERWDGEGFPAKAFESEIPIIARIVAAANELDRVSVRKHSETPFEYAVRQLAADGGKQFDPALIAVVSDSQMRLKRIFTNFISQTRAIPAADPVIRRTTKRPFSLWYRPIVDVKQKKTAAFEAEMRFRDKGDTWVGYSEVEHIVKRDGLMRDLTEYFLVELCDTAARIDTCGIPAAYIAFAPPNGWLNVRGLQSKISSVLEDTVTQAGRLCVVVTAEAWTGRTKTMQENLKKIAELGCPVMFSGLGIGEAAADELKECGASFFRIGPEAGETLDDSRTAEYLKGLSAAGIVLMADGIEKKRKQALFGKNKISYATGELIGAYQPEDTMIECELALLD